MRPYSNNIIFYDAEFTHLDCRVGELLSIGLVKPTGEELYIEFDYKGPVHPWVEKNVLPVLNKKKISKKEAAEKIIKFIGSNRKKIDKPYLMAYVNQFDSVFWYDLFESAKDHPVYWIPIDFASMLFASGYSPNSMGKKSFFEELGIDKEKYNGHNALEDAKLLQQVYIKFMDKIHEKS
ncbi:MAG: hypothetical protein GF349_04620 [Candidatus Magasanikbacteria bacterium]|nr:hypothetical protein [Candidatus Magasanikbacteria bacterium]